MTSLAAFVARILRWLPFPSFVRRALKRLRSLLPSGSQYAEWFAAGVISVLTAIVVVWAGRFVANHLWSLFGWLSQNSVDALRAYNFAIRLLAVLLAAKVSYEFLTREES